MACWTVVIFSASSSGISVSNSSSSAITSSTVSSESAPKSSTNEDWFLISASLTPSCSAMIFLTRCSTFSIRGSFLWGAMPVRGSRGGRILRHNHAAVDVQHCSRDVAAAGRNEIGDGGSDVLRRAEPPERNVLEQRLSLRLGKRARHIGVDEARRNAVHRDVAAAELAGERLRHAGNARLGGGVVGLPWISRLADH